MTLYEPTKKTVAQMTAEEKSFAHMDATDQAEAIYSRLIRRGSAEYVAVVAGIILDRARQAMPKAPAQAPMGDEWRGS